MATVHLLSAAPVDPERYPKAFVDLEQLLACAGSDRFGIHELTDSPLDADLIIFVEVSGNAGYYFEKVRRHPVYRRFMDKSYLFCSTDRFVPFLPGVYACVERAWNWRAWTRSGHYLGVREEGHLRYRPDAGPPRFLFSFVGSTATHPVRGRLVALRDRDALLIDSGGESRPMMGHDPHAPVLEERQKRYADSIRDSAFVLSPRGGGASSFRLFETMMLGRAPVIIADAWVPPDGPDWDSFSVRVREADVDLIPGILHDLAPQADAMGRAARTAWVDWFSETASFHRIVEWCLDLAAWAPARRTPRRYAPNLQLLRPYHSARWAVKRLQAQRPAQ